MIRALVVVPRTLHPARSGGELRVVSLMRALRGRVEFTALTFWESGIELDQAAGALELERRHGVKTVFVRRTPGWRPPPGGAPDIADSFHDPALERAVRGLSEASDLVQLEFTQTLQYASCVAPGVPVVAVEHDTSALSADRSYLRLEGEAAARERALTLAYLKRTLAGCARVVTMSEADKARLEQAVPGARVAVVPTGVDLEEFAFAPLAGREPGLCAFLGHYPHFPNEDAALFLAREVLPLLRRGRPEARLLLIGSAPTPAVRALAGDGVELAPDVPRVAPVLRRARAFVAPMRLGFGIKGKILEAFATGTPVVATRGSFEAMPGVEHGVHALMGDDARDLADLASQALCDDALAQRLASSGRRYVEERFGWDRQAALLERVYRDLVRGS